MNITEFSDLLGSFELKGSAVDITECKNGNINKTYVVSTNSGRKYILQRVNENVFKNPDKVMENILLITEYLREKIKQRGGDPTRETLTLIPATSGGYSVRDSRGGFWRLYDGIRDAVSYDKIERPGLFRNAGLAFGDFQSMLADFEIEKLHDTIPDFHNTPMRYKALQRAVSADEYNIAASVTDEIAFIEKNSNICPIITDGLDLGELPWRVTHNDTKLNNIMMDVVTDKAVCVIDLDTVMPGSLLFDYGDAIRYGASNAGEDEKDLSQVYIKPELFREFTYGFIEGLGGALFESEAKNFTISVAVIALELGMRFLTDYLNGDKYFTVRYDGQNLDRARTQLKLVSDVLAKRDELDEIVESALKQLSEKTYTEKPERKKNERNA